MMRDGYNFFAACLRLAGLFLIVSCGKITTPKQQSQPLTPVTSSGLLGLVLVEQNSSLSSAVHFYDFKKGELSLVASGESGDVIVEQMGSDLAIFNRSLGRVSFRIIKQFASSPQGSQESATPNTNTFDPGSVLFAKNGDLILAHTQESKMSVLTKDSGYLQSIEFKNFEIDSSKQEVFRPGLMKEVSTGEVLILHQSFDQNYLPVGQGQIFRGLSQNADGNQDWTFHEKASYRLSVTNPVYLQEESSGGLLVGGVCYRHFWPKATCVDGVDLVDRKSAVVTHLWDFDHTDWLPNGNLVDDLDAAHGLACVIRKKDGKSYLRRWQLYTGEILGELELDGGYCAGVISDRSSQRIFVGLRQFEGGGKLLTLDSKLNVLEDQRLSIPLMGLTPFREY